MEKVYKSGISRASILPILYGMIVLVPASMFLQLVGVQAGIAGSWFVLLLFVEFAKLSGVRFSKQEALVMFLFSGGLATGLPMTLLYTSWLTQSDIVRFFGLYGEFPVWFGPTPESGAFLSRNLFHPGFLSPTFYRILHGAAALLTTWAIALWARELFVETEDLPFPIQEMNVQTMLVISGSESGEEGEFPTRLLSVAALIGFIYGFIIYALPFVTQAWTGRYMTVIPIPWFDLTSQIGMYLPGAFFGIATDLALYTLGFILPLRIILQMAIGSFAVWIIGSWLTVDLNQPYGPSNWWFPGMTTQTGWGRAWLYFFTSPFIGLGLAAAIAPLLLNPGLVKRALSLGRRGAKKGRRIDEIPYGTVRGLVVPLIVGFAIILGVFVFLVPSFVVQYPWFLAIMVTMPFLDMLLAGRALGETGVTLGGTGGATVPYVTQSLFYTLGAPTDVWSAQTFANASWGYMAPHAPTLLGNFKMAQLTETKASTILKIYIIFFPIRLLLSFMFLQSFWSVGPIPSEKFPGPAIFWPQQAATFLVWVKGRETGLFNVQHLLYGFGAGFGIYAVSFFAHLPISLISLTAGASSPPHYAFAWLIGGIVSLNIEQIAGRDFWMKHRRIVAGGIAMGEAIAITLGVSVALIINSLWVLPY